MVDVEMGRKMMFGFVVVTVTNETRLLCGNAVRSNHGISTPRNCADLLQFAE